MQQKDILLKFVQGRKSNGTSWVDQRDKGWRHNSTDAVCTWDGITCNASNNIYAINLKGTNYTGTIPPEVGSLDHLNHLYLSGNNIYGAIPDSILSHQKLTHFDVSENKVRGETPIFQSPKIQVVNLSRNQLTGKIPDNIGDTGGKKSSSLLVFDLKYNRVSGTIPKSFGAISTNLMELDLSNNKLFGKIPKSLGKLLKMQGIFLSNNKLHGPIPSQLLHNDMEQLKQIFVHGNLLSGTVPIGLADLPNLKNLFIDDNKFTGTMPPEICKLNLNEAFFQAEDVPVRGGDKDYDDYILWDDDDVFDDDDEWDDDDEFDDDLYDDDVMDVMDDYSSENPGLLYDDVYQTEVYNKMEHDADVVAEIGQVENKQYEEEAVIMSELKKVEELEVDEETAIIEEMQDLQQQQLASTSKEEYDALQAQIKGLEEDLNEVEVVRGKEEAGLEADYEEIDMTRDQQVEQLEGELNNRMLHERKAKDDLDFEGTIRNGCNSVACPAGYRSTKEGKDGVFPCLKCSHDLVNPYLGSSRCYEVNQRLILSHFYYATEGKDWLGDHKSWDTVDIPVCEWEGVRCNANNDIVSITLSNSNLKGTISEDLGFLRHLGALDLSNNHLIGNLPSELHYVPLEKLDISGNMLTGFVPPLMCEKSGLNGNGDDGKFSCSQVACSVGTHSSTGHASSVEECSACRSNEYSYLGDKACVAYQSVEATRMSESGAGIVSAIFVASIVISCVIGVMILRMRSIKKGGYSMGVRASDFVSLRLGRSDGNAAYHNSNLAPAAKNQSSDPFSSGTFAMSAMEVKAQDQWNTGKDSSSEVWLDVPRIT